MSVTLLTSQCSMSADCAFSAHQSLTALKSSVRFVNTAGGGGGDVGGDGGGVDRGGGDGGGGDGGGGDEGGDGGGDEGGDGGGGGGDGGDGGGIGEGGGGDNGHGGGGGEGGGGGTIVSLIPCLELMRLMNPTRPVAKGTENSTVRAQHCSLKGFLPACEFTDLKVSKGAPTFLTVHVKDCNSDGSSTPR